MYRNVLRTSDHRILQFLTTKILSGLRYQQCITVLNLSKKSLEKKIIKSLVKSTK